MVIKCLDDTIYTSYLKDSLSINVAYNDWPGYFEIVNNSMVEYPVDIRSVDSYVPYNYEILKIFFKTNNIIVNWIDCNYTWGWYDYEIERWTGAVGKVRINIFVDIK